MKAHVTHLTREALKRFPALSLVSIEEPTTSDIWSAKAYNPYEVDPERRVVSFTFGVQPDDSETREVITVAILEKLS